MPVMFSDSEILALINEPKIVPITFREKIKPKARTGHNGSELAIEGAAGSNFVVMVRVNQIDPLDFSVILAFEPEGSSKRFLLRRYNGKSHRHSNVLEKGKPFFDFHIHMATERYQRADRSEVCFAEVTDRYSDWTAALDCLIEDCNIVMPDGVPNLFS
jgi:hypothetical protein